MRVAIRVPHWEQVLADAVQEASARPFAWGQHDCATWAFDLHRELTDGPDHAALWRGRYRTPIGCGRVFAALAGQALKKADAPCWAHHLMMCASHSAAI